jgi:hypothetical protein
MRRSSFLIAASSLGLGLALASCGSRTGLFGSDEPFTSTNGGDGGTNDAQPSLDARPDAPVPCVPGDFDLHAAIAQLMFVIDRSGSMAASLDGRDPRPGEKSRWQVLRDGLAQTLTGYDGQIAMGAKFYPDITWSPSSQCSTATEVELEPNLGNAASILKVFEDTIPMGGTPTADAVRIAADRVSSVRGIARTLVVATDGAPNCNFNHPGSPCVCTSNNPADCQDVAPSTCLDDTRTVATIREVAEQRKVPVYVIGIGSFERADFRRTLNDMAVAGGRPRPDGGDRYYRTQTPAELDGALASIRDGIARCTFLTPSAPSDPNAIVVTIDGVAVTRDPSRTDGWDWVDQSYGTLALFGAACDRAQRGRMSGTVRCD